MSLNLAPYNDAMKLGQGFNSYTQQLCIDGAVSITSTETKGQKKLSQVVSYSARLVEKLSDVVEGMNLSYCSSIKKGTVEVSGSTTTVNENSFKTSDLNAVISVKVTNQTIMTDGEATFISMKGVEPGSASFNQSYGDSYISGFVTGGEFTGIVSIKVIDRSKTASTVNKIKSALAKSNETTELTFDPIDSTSSNSLSSVMTGIESTISVAWMGGGQVKDASTPWDLQSVLTAAAAFPAKVAECPQRTWAILTKYKANRSFVETCNKSQAQVLEYDQIHSYTAELFDHYMDYKLLLKHLQAIIADRDSFQMRTGVKDALDVSLGTLLSVKAVLRHEQSKIVQAVRVLSDDPGALARQAPTVNVNQSAAVLNILAAHGLGGQAGKVQIASNINSSTSTIDEDAVLIGEDTPEEAVTAQQVVVSTFDFASLIAPEVWEDVMPVGKPSAQPQASGVSSVSSTALLAGFRLPASVSDDYQPPAAASERRAIQGMEEDLERLRKEVVDAKQATADATRRADEAERARAAANSDFQSQLTNAEYTSKNLNNQLADAVKAADAARSAEGNVRVELTEKKSRLDVTTTENASLKSGAALKDKEIQDLRAQINTLATQILPDDQTREQVNIFAITYEDCYWSRGDTNMGTWARMMDKARTGETFTVTTNLMTGGRDPAPGKRKFMTVAYRRGKTGPVKFIYGTEGDQRRFE